MRQRQTVPTNRRIRFHEHFQRLPPTKKQPNEHLQNKPHERIPRKKLALKRKTHEFQPTHPTATTTTLLQPTPEPYKQQYDDEQQPPK